MSQKLQAEREYKDRLFKWIFGRRKDYAQSLVKSLFHLTDEDVEDLVFVTLENVVFIGMKNDVGVLVHLWIILFEQQSTWSKYMPLRFTEYYQDVLNDLIEEAGQDILHSSSVDVFRPKFIAFYTGHDKKLPERFIVKFSDLFMDAGSDEQSSPFDVLWYNLNEGFNNDLKDECEPLKEYCWIINRIDNYRRNEHFSLEDSIERTLQEMPDEFMIKEELMANIAEVKGMLQTEFNEEKYEKKLKDIFTREGREEGRVEGREEGREEGLKKSLETLIANLMLTDGISRAEATIKAKKLLSL